MRSPIEYLNRRIAIRRLDWSEALEKGERLLRSGKPAESIPYLYRSIQANPGEYGTSNSHKQARTSLAEAFEKTGQHRKAVALLKEMTPAQYWWSAIRAGLLTSVFMIIGVAAILFGSMFLLFTFAGQKLSPISLALARGEATMIDVRFETPVDVSAQAAVVEPASRYEGMFPWAVRPWKGFDHRDVGTSGRGGARSRAREVVIEGQPRSLVYEIGPPDIVNGYGGSRVTISADHDVPAGLYKIWLAGAYLDHTRRTKRFNPDLIIWQAGPSEKETVPLDAGVSVPVIEVTVK